MKGYNSKVGIEVELKTAVRWFFPIRCGADGAMLVDGGGGNGGAGNPGDEQLGRE